MNNGMPVPPTEISNDGRELWDWAGSLGAWVVRQQRARDIRKAILEGLTTCGSCDLWMTSNCPREKHDSRGRSTGPSCKSAKCSKFQIKKYDAERLKGLADELAALEVPHD